MSISSVKINAQKRMVKNQAKLFLVCLFPYLLAFALFALVYYSYSFLMKTSYDFFGYAYVVKPAILTLVIVASYFLYKWAVLVTDKFLFFKSRGRKTKLFSVIKTIKLSNIIALFLCSILKGFLFFAWAGVYFLPAAVTAGIGYYAFSRGYNFKILAVLLISVLMLFLIGSVFLFVTFKRYSFCSEIIIETGEKDALKVLSSSISISNGSLKKTALLSLSFIGWNMLCLFVLPAVFVLPYKKMAKKSAYNILSKSCERESKKPVVFYIKSATKA